MGRVGSTLTAAREATGRSIADFEAETRIPVRYIEALELEAFDELPAPVYVRGFIRIYARHLHVSAALLLDQLPAALREPEERLASGRAVMRPPALAAAELADERRALDIAVAPERLLPPTTPIDRPSSDSYPLAPELERESGAPRERGRRLLIAAVASVAALAAVGFIAIRTGDGRTTGPGGEPGASVQNGVTAPTTAPTGGPTAPPAVTSAPTAEPAAAPTKAPTAAVAIATPVIPAAFAYCEPVGRGNFTCGPSPWRVVCTPSGPFFDPAGTVPRPIPPEWTGWSETTVEGRLEYIWDAC